MKENLESIFDHYPFFIHIILTLSQNKEEKISIESLELLKKSIVILFDRIFFLKEEQQKKASLFEQTSSNSENIQNQLENWQNILNSAY